MDTTQVYNLIRCLLTKNKEKNNNKNEKAENSLVPPPPPHFLSTLIIMATNVAKTFLTLIYKHFPKDKKLSKIFHRNTTKVNYNCLPKVKRTISNNNNRSLQRHRMKKSTQDSKLCNCRHEKLLPT